MRLVFMGSPEFSVPVLDALIAAGHEVAAVYCQPPRPAGRGKKDRPTPVHARALELGLEVRHPKSLRTAEAQAEFAGFAAEIAVVVAYGLILPQAVLDAPARGCLNIHASLLPRWRGAAPIHRAVMAGDAETGVCIMQMEAGLDTGPVLLRKALEIGPEETTGALHDRVSALGAAAIVEALDRLDSLVPEPQPEAGVTYAEKIDKAEARVDWTRPAVEIDRLIRGLAPFPGAWTEIGGERVKLLGSRRVAGAGAPGTILPPFTVACGDGAVEITRAQRPGKRAMDQGEFLKGFDLPDRVD
ncbi:MAG: methionyl-tRNA formyltransferase [Maritimibacter sp.]|nr:methionyl-tRNA formyltransferase [Maritimibacter sp.]